MMNDELKSRSQESESRIQNAKAETALTDFMDSLFFWHLNSVFWIPFYFIIHHSAFSVLYERSNGKLWG
jgi:hypothetical protein